MGPAWLGLLGAVVGGLVSLIGTLVTTRVQWRQERARWQEQRERDLLQWQQQRAADMEKWESERRRETISWERTRADEKSDWLRDQKLTSYLEILDHLLAASELASNLPPAMDDETQPYTREDEMAIVRELKKGYRWMRSASAVCGNEVSNELADLTEELYFTMQTISYEGIRPGRQVRRPEKRNPNPWLLNEVIDQISAKVSTVSRKDLDAG
jgi:hypothetical protein